MTTVHRLHQLQEHLQALCSDLQIDYAERADDPRDDEINLTFTYEEEAQVDRLIRAARVSFASYGPESFLPESHPGAAQFHQSEQMKFRVHKSLILSHMYWSVSFILCGQEEGYSLLENAQP